MGRQLFSHLWRAVEETKEPLIPGVTRLGGRPGRRPPERSSSSPSPEWLPLTPSGHLPSNELLLGSKKAPGETATTSQLSAWGHCFLKQSSPGLLHCTSRRAHPEGCPPPPTTTPAQKKATWPGGEEKGAGRHRRAEVPHPCSPSLPETQLSKQPRLSTRQQRFLLGEVKRAAALGKGGHGAPDLINKPALLLM